MRYKQRLLRSVGSVGEDKVKNVFDDRMEENIMVIKEGLKEEQF